jgi:hypothetical protein
MDEELERNTAAAVWHRKEKHLQSFSGGYLSIIICMHRWANPFSLFAN